MSCSEVTIQSGKLLATMPILDRSGAKGFNVEVHSIEDMECVSDRKLLGGISYKGSQELRCEYQEPYATRAASKMTTSVKCYLSDNIISLQAELEWPFALQCFCSDHLFSACFFATSKRLF